MDAWTGHEVPPLPGTGAPLALYDSARRPVHPTAARSRPATMYVCGITPVRRDPPRPRRHDDHVRPGQPGRGATPASSVRYVQNVTDIDDPLLERAARDGEDWIVLAMRETALFREDMEALRIIPPAHYVGAVESIPAIAAQVARAARRAARRTGWTTAPATSTSPVAAAPRLRVRVQPVPRRDAGALRRARRRPGPRRQARPARPAAVARRPRRRAGLGRRRRSAPAAPAGTSSAP